MTKVLSRFTVLAAFLTIAGTVSADTTTVQQVGLLFIPQDITIQQGDTVHWVWTSGSHTVTNGTGFGDPNMGLLFNAPLDISNPDFYYTFDGATGLYDYFCVPHFFLGMVGTVTVEEGSTATEKSAWGDIKKLFSRE